MLTFVFSCIIIQSHYHYKNSKFKILNEINIIIIIIIEKLIHLSDEVKLTVFDKRRQCSLNSRVIPKLFLFA